MQLDVVLLYQLVLDAVDFGHNGDGRPCVLGPRERNAGQHLLFALREEIVHVSLPYGRRAPNAISLSSTGTRLQLGTVDEPFSLPSQSWKTKAPPSPSAARAWRCRRRRARVSVRRGGAKPI